jgi:hypothetical protein
VLAVGNDGKRAPGGFVIPEFVTDAELEQFLFDLFHEQAVYKKGGIFRVGGPCGKLNRLLGFKG